jgi:hypothetical protein
MNLSHGGLSQCERLAGICSVSSGAQRRQRAKDVVARVDLGLDAELVAEAAKRVESAEGAARGVEADEEGELWAGDRPTVHAHEVGELVSHG